MADRNQDIKARLLAIFRVEAEEHLQAITANLLVLERELLAEQACEVVEATFREVHTLKGAARSVSLMDVDALCQAMESVLSRITRGHLALSRPILDRLHEAVDGVARLLVGGEGRPAVTELVRRLEQAASEAGIGSQEQAVSRQPSARRRLAARRLRSSASLRLSWMRCFSGPKTFWSPSSPPRSGSGRPGRLSKRWPG